MIKESIKNWIMRPAETAWQKVELFLLIAIQAASVVLYVLQTRLALTVLIVAAFLLLLRTTGMFLIQYREGKKLKRGIKKVYYWLFNISEDLPAKERAFIIGSMCMAYANFLLIIFYNQSDNEDFNFIPHIVIFALQIGLGIAAVVLRRKRLKAMKENEL